MTFFQRVLRRADRHDPSSPARPEALHDPGVVLEHLQDGVVAVDASGRILFTNPAARRLLGVDADAPDGQRLWELTRQPALQETIAAARKRFHAAPQELSVFTPEERTVQVRAVPDRGAEDSVVVLFHDVTSLRRLERVRQDFVANVSHELRTPLTSIKGFIETLLQGALEDPAHGRPFLQLVEEDVNRLARLTDDLLELSRAESLGKPKSLQPVDTLQIVQEVVATLAPQKKAKRLTVTVDCLGPLPPAKGDPDQLRQVFWNLLENAVKYNVEGGSVVVRIRHHKAFLYLDVEDTGIGIPPEELPRIFERFYRVDKGRSRALGGTGLGLSIVKHLVESHDGEVRVESEPGRGSTFRISLPVWSG